MKRVEVDARRLFCPMPVIRCQDQVALLQPGDRVVIYSTDPGALNDIPAWARINGHLLIDSSQQETDYVVEIEVGND